MDSILIFDFGSQYTQLIARKIREHHVYCDILPWNASWQSYVEHKNLKGIVLSGSPYSVRDDNAPKLDVQSLPDVPVLGICFGAQWITQALGGIVEPSKKREYGRARLVGFDEHHPLFRGIQQGTVVWMSHSDSITTPAPHATILARTENIPFAAFEIPSRKIFGLQFHPEVYHTEEGDKFIDNFLNICGCRRDWSPGKFVQDSIESIQQQVGSEHVIMALSGGVDSTVAATLISKAIGNRLHAIFIDNGLLRKNEYQLVLNFYRDLGINVHGIDASKDFLQALRGIVDPEQKRKVIGKLFYEIFEQEAEKLQNVTFLAQGTIYPDVIESISVAGPSQTIKSHHNVGGLPLQRKLKLLEPLRFLFKDEVRKVGKELGLPDEILKRHPFPGPGLAIRIIGEVTADRIALLQEADNIFIEELKRYDLYDKVWQAFVVLLPVQSVGVMGDERTYESTVVLRAVTSRDGMTADWAHLPYEFLAHVSARIVNEVNGINRVVYDISSKPPATIEWE